MAERDYSKEFEQRVLREVHKPEPEKKGWKSSEESLVNDFRKLSENERLEVMCYAQNLAIARIGARLRKKRAASDRRFQRFMETATSERDHTPP